MSTLNLFIIKQTPSFHENYTFEYQIDELSRGRAI